MSLAARTVEEAMEATMALVPAVRRSLSLALWQATRPRRERGLRRGLLDAGRLALVCSGNTRVFCRRERSEELKAAVAIAVDDSFSMWAHDRCNKLYRLTEEDIAENWQESRFGRSKLCLVALAEALFGLDVAFCIYGFSVVAGPTRDLRGDVRSAGRNAERSYNGRRVRAYKGFAQPWDAACVADYLALSDRDSTQHILKAADDLAARAEPVKLLLVLSDGGLEVDVPADGWQCWRQKQALRGVHVLPIGLVRAVSPEFFPNARLVKDVRELPEVALARLRNEMVRVVSRVR